MEVNNVLVREWLNGALIPMFALIIMMISYQLYIARKMYGRGWTRRKGVASACAFWWIFVSEFIRSTMAWNFLNQQSTTGKMPALTSFVALAYAAAAAIAFVATLRLVYTLSPPCFSHRSWIGALAITALFLTVLYSFA